MSEHNKLPPALLQRTPWSSPIDPIWPASIFALHRNLANFSFPGKLTAKQLEQVASLLSPPLLGGESLQSPLFLSAEELTPLDKEFLFEHFLSEQGFEHTLTGQGFIVDTTGAFLAILNMDDHLQLHMIDCQGNWDTAWNALSKLEAQIGAALGYAFSSRFGYLTADPSLSGTGLTASIYLHLPALFHTGQLFETFLKQKEEEVIGVGMGGSAEELIGDFFVLKNKYSTGVSEEHLLRTLHSTAMKMIAREKSTRTELLQHDNTDIKDQVSRAYGLLIHSYQLETKETLGALSLLKLGIDLGWVKGISDGEINEIFFKSRRAHLAYLRQLPVVAPQVVHRGRAEFLHAVLKGASLTY